jgi:hypothetical protein
MRDTTHNPFNETHWVSCLRENLTSSSYGEGLETDRAMTQVPRQSFTRQQSRLYYPYTDKRLLSYYCPNRIVAARYRRGQVLASSRRRERERMSPRVLPPRP